MGADLKLVVNTRQRLREAAMTELQAASTVTRAQRGRRVLLLGVAAAMATGIAFGLIGAAIAAVSLGLVGP